MRAHVKKVVEELCQDPDCRLLDTHWHPFSVEDLVAESGGPYPCEYTITLRVAPKKLRKAVKR